MKLSTKGRYGVMACYDLACHHGDSPVPLKAIASRQGISPGYLEQLIGHLRRAGIVRSVRGPQGGYVLARSPDEITVGDIIRVLEGPIAPVECVSQDPGDFRHCGRTDGCVTRPVWEKLRDSMVRVLDSITLKDLLDEGGRE
ncbi:MAG TPA: Rrf2 family transcriptional regulator [Clostridiales bacterium]|nr:Rrf2 family transcriptional regulator [Clostridiales bacterium]